MKQFFAVGVCALSLALVGCSDAQPTNVMEGTEQSAVDAYNQMLEEEAAMMAQEDESGATGGEVAETPAP